MTPRTNVSIHSIHIVNSGNNNIVRVLGKALVRSFGNHLKTHLEIWNYFGVPIMVFLRLNINTKISKCSGTCPLGCQNPPMKWKATWQNILKSRTNFGFLVWSPTLMYWKFFCVLSKMVLFLQYSLLSPCSLIIFALWSPIHMRCAHERFLLWWVVAIIRRGSSSTHLNTFGSSLLPTLLSSMEMESFEHHFASAHYTHPMSHEGLWKKLFLFCKEK